MAAEAEVETAPTEELIPGLLEVSSPGETTPQPAGETLLISITHSGSVLSGSVGREWCLQRQGLWVQFPLGPPIPKMYACATKSLWIEASAKWHINIILIFLQYTVHSESIQTPRPFLHFVMLQPKNVLKSMA